MVGRENNAPYAGVEQTSDGGLEHIERGVERTPARCELVGLAVGVDLGRPDKNECRSLDALLEFAARVLRQLVERHIGHLAMILLETLDPIRNLTDSPSVDVHNEASVRVQLDVEPLVGARGDRGHANRRDRRGGGKRCANVDGGIQPPEPCGEISAELVPKRINKHISRALPAAHLYVVDAALLLLIGNVCIAGDRVRCSSQYLVEPLLVALATEPERVIQAIQVGTSADSYELHPTVCAIDLPAG